MKLKVIVLMMLSVLILSLVGCGNSNIEKEPENSPAAVSSGSQDNSEKEKIAEIVANAFEQYFDIKVDNKKIMDNMQFNDNNEFWLTLWTDTESNVEYYAVLTKDGEIKEIGYGNTKASSSNLDKEEAKKIAVDFIKKHFAEKDEDIKFTGIGNLGDIDFTYGEDEKTGGNKVIFLSVDPENKKVCSFTLDIEPKK